MIAPLLALWLAAAAVDSVPGVRMGTQVLPETVTVGTPFRVVVRVQAPAGATSEFPPAPDSAAAVELLDTRSIRATPGAVGAAGAAGVDQTATYRMAAWDVGTQPLQLSDVIVSSGGRETRASLAGLRVFVASVLPADSAKRVPRGPRGLFVPGPPWWRYWWIAAILAALALLAWLWWRRRRRPRPALVIDPWALAEREFARVEALGLLEAGERGRFVALMVEVLRDYLARRAPEAPASLTSTELLRALRLNPDVPVERLEAVLSESDLVKFARRSVTPERARELARETRSVVRDVDRAVVARADAVPTRSAA